MAECNCENCNGIEVNPTIKLAAQVEMGSKASENNAEAWAVGQRGGVPVAEGDPAYENNAKYYAEKTAQDRASTSEASKAVADGVAQALEYVQQADGYASAAEIARAAAEAAAKDAADTVIAAQGPGILYIGEDGIPYVLDE